MNTPCCSTRRSTRRVRRPASLSRRLPESVRVAPPARVPRLRSPKRRPNPFAPRVPPARPRLRRPPASSRAAPTGCVTDDTLWEIASAANPGSRSNVNRAMVAIFQNNPQAFDGNINVLRSGSLLRIPDASQISSVSASEASAEVARQYDAWRNGTATAAASEAGTAPPRHAGAGHGSAVHCDVHRACRCDTRRDQLERRRPRRQATSRRASSSSRANSPKPGACSKCATPNSRHCRAVRPCPRMRRPRLAPLRPSRVQPPWKPRPRPLPPQSRRSPTSRRSRKRQSSSRRSRACSSASPTTGGCCSACWPRALAPC